MIRFLLNDTVIETGQPAGSTVLDFVRYQKRLMGTKTGCREGDCGACTILVGDFENGQLRYRSATSCLMLLGNAAGKHIVTVEGLNMQQLSPVQQAMVDTNGTQCGFCTLGFVLSFTGFIMDPVARNYDEAIAAIDGNICRCTGYKSIERAARRITDDIQGKPSEGTIEWLLAQGFLPQHFAGIEEKLRGIQVADSTTGAIVFVGGGTDLVVQKPHFVKESNVRLLANDPALRIISEENEKVHIGASVTVTQLLESKIINRHFPEFAGYIKLVSSTPIRNMATVAGNLVNASPIGDLTIFFLALDAQVTLQQGGDTQRTILLKNFYKGYKQLEKAADEWIVSVSFVPPAADTFFHFEKVSKRTWLDIASVNCACQLRMNSDQTIEFVHLSAGGVGPMPKYLADTSAFLTGKSLSTDIIEQALDHMDREISPISDARGTAVYKRLLLRQLFAAHLQHFELAPAFLENLLPA
jgi:xanthine dehydrogenase small subunit